MNEPITSLWSLYNKIKFWQITTVIAIALLGLGFTGNAIFIDTEVLEGKENAAIYGGFATLIASIILRYVPAPERRILSRTKANVSPAQAALASQIVEWIPTEKAAGFVTADYTLDLALLRCKNTELRIKLGLLQGILKSRVNNSGKQEIRYRYNPQGNNS